MPAVASTRAPGASRPSASAASIMLRAGLDGADGLALSSLRNSRQGPQSMRVTSRRGVLPIRSSADVMPIIHHPDGHASDDHSTSARFTASGRSMVDAAIGNDDQARGRDAGDDLLRQRRRGERVAVADQHEGRAADRREERRSSPRAMIACCAQEGGGAGLPAMRRTSARRRHRPGGRGGRTRETAAAESRRSVRSARGRSGAGAARRSARAEVSSRASRVTRSGASRTTASAM